MTDRLITRAAGYYSRKLAEFGATPRGADWNSQESQDLRFHQLLRVCEGAPLDINDYGCGYGALVDFLERSGRDYDYSGYDAAPSMVAAAAERFASRPRCRFTADRSELPARPYTVASGIFNVREDTSDAEWWEYIARTIDDIRSISTAGFSCNFLTSHSDPDRRRPDLFYADPSEVLRWALTKFPRRAAIAHDYPLYEFTLMVKV